MIKKSFGVALIAASVLVMGCSSDDDDATPPVATDAGNADTATADGGMTDTAAADGGMTDTAAADGGMTDTAAADGGMTDTATADGGMTDTATADGGMTDTAADGGMTDTGPTDGGMPDGPEYNANSVMGLIAADARLSALAGALNPDFDQTLDTAGQNWTVFAPTNDALTASGAAVTGPLLQSHIFTQGILNAADLTPGTTVSMSNNSVYTITAGDDGGLLIGGVAIIEADLPADNGALHVIDGVLIPQ